LSIVERYVWRNEAESLSGINLDELANPPAKHGANQDVRVQNDHLTSRRLPTPTHLFELSHEFSFIHAGEGFRQPVSGGFEFRKLRCLASFSPRWNIDTQCLATASDSDRCVRLKESRNPIPKLTDAYL
jgi:hypothetical protein